MLLIALSGRVIAVDNVAWTEALSSIRATDLQNHVEVLASDAMEGRASGTKGALEAAKYLAQHFRDAGLQPMGDDGGYYQAFGRSFRNVVGWMEGSDATLKGEFVVIGAHYDHVGYGSRRNSFGPIGVIHNGADDNASGCSGVLEVLDAMRTLRTPPKRSIVFAMWDGEELGLLGSQHFVENPPVPLNQIVLAIHLDMIGKLRDEHLVVYGTRTSPGLRRLIAETPHDARLQLDFDWELKPNSDHYPFVEHRVPAILFHTCLHDDMHRPSDDPETLNSDGMEQSARLAFSVAWDVATRATTLAFRDASRQEQPADQRQLERPLPPASPRLGIRWQQDGQPPGLVVESVDPGSAAERSGIRVGDRFVEFAGQPVRDGDSFRRAVLAAVSPVQVAVQRAHESDPVRLDTPTGRNSNAAGRFLEGRHVRTGDGDCDSRDSWFPCRRCGNACGRSHLRDRGTAFPEPNGIH